MNTSTMCGSIWSNGIQWEGFTDERRRRRTQSNNNTSGEGNPIKFDKYVHFGSLINAIMFLYMTFSRMSQVNKFTLKFEL